jgi:hypothetical protein
MSSIDVSFAQTMLVSISATQSLAMADGSTSPLIGCSPQADAMALRGRPSKPRPNKTAHRSKDAKRAVLAAKCVANSEH